MTRYIGGRKVADFIFLNPPVIKFQKQKEKGRRKSTL